ncbi:unnamed protein product [Spirodela intermedia]|uniref:Uncharacterized protein n=1 Tax=Spirodela intermedia TaxID=51605 RepID=A0A7I8KZN3_SPIIN|nr:unnamed protein product [Spirodela intermedia]
MCSRGIRRSRWSRVGALYLAVFFRFSPIHALPEVSRWPPVAGDVSELEELKLTVSRLELILEKNIEDLNSRFLFHQEKDKTIKEMSSKIQDLQDSICHIKKSRATSSCSEERVKILEEEIRSLWSEARKNSFDIHTLESKAYDAEEKLHSVSTKVHEMEDIITEQWIQIRQLEQTLQIIKVRTSIAKRKINPTECTFLKFISDLRQHYLAEIISQLELLFLKINSTLRGYPSHAFDMLRRLISHVQSRHRELQGYVRQLMGKNEFTTAFANQEVVFFVASAMITLPFMAAWILYSSRSESLEEG